MKVNQEFKDKFIGLVQQVRNGTLNLSVDGDVVLIFVNEELKIKMPMDLFLKKDVNDILEFIGEDVDKDLKQQY
mgnify:FL=1|jgi:hypothetical protein|tara:strand:- start:11958 stop:12179 length:222 start_codon:yes stop_codon:yes gene_type:complete